MKKHTFISDGKTKDFYFTGKFFLKSDIVVLLNGVAASGYNLICTTTGRDSDIPYTGGRVHFYKPPRVSDVITIYRDLPLNRIADYQPTARYNPVTLNRDLNYLMEVLNDIHTDMDDVAAKYADITDADLLKNVSARIDMIMTTIEEKISHIDNMAGEIGRIPELGDSIDRLAQTIGEMSSLIGANKSDITTNAANITQMRNMINGISDYVVEYQEPTAANNYTWYRKYASGWVEQGGVQAGLNNNRTTITLPVKMASSKYTAVTSGINGTSASEHAVAVVNPTQTTIILATTANYGTGISWYVCGTSA